MKVFIGAPVKCNFCHIQLTPNNDIRDKGLTILNHPFDTSSGGCPYNGKIVKMPVFEAEEYPITLNG